MSTIRRQSIISSGIVYFGFALGLLNSYLFTRQGGVTEAQYGLTGTFLAFANIMFAFAGVGMPAYVGKFFPYYHSHLAPQKNDQLSWALLVSCTGFLLVLIGGIAFKHVLVDKVFNNSQELLQYYYWTFPFGFGFTLFSVLEAYAWQQHKAVLSNFLKEVVFRFLITALVVLVTLRLVHQFDTFVALYSFLYLAIALVLLVYFLRRRSFYFHFSVSRVTQKFFKKILILVSFTWGGSLVFNIASVFDTIVIVAVVPNGVAAVAPFLLAQNISSLMQAPQRAIVSAAVGPLSRAWREKDLARIGRIYQRSAINQLLFACAMFCLIWLNFTDGVHTFHLQEKYIQAKWVFFFIGLAKIVDMGTGVNAQIIATSTRWRFECMSGMVLLAFTLPLNWLLTQRYDIMGPAYSNLISFSLYNLIRCIFLWRRYHMQPFNAKTVYTLLLAAADYLLVYALFHSHEGFGWIALRSLVFVVIYLAVTHWLRLSEDVLPVMNSLGKRLRLQR